MIDLHLNSFKMLQLDANLREEKERALETALFKFFLHGEDSLESTSQNTFFSR